MPYIIGNAILMCLFVVLALFVRHRASQHRRGALAVLHVRRTVKLLISAMALLVILINFPQSMHFLGYVLSFVLICFSADIIVEEGGVYYGFILIPWEKITEISGRANYLMIKTDRKLSRKGFLKIIWKISSKDVE